MVLPMFADYIIRLGKVNALIKTAPVHQALMDAICSQSYLEVFKSSQIMERLIRFKTRGSRWRKLRGKR